MFNDTDLRIYKVEHSEIEMILELVGKGENSIHPQMFLQLYKVIEMIAPFCKLIEKANMQLHLLGSIRCLCGSSLALRFGQKTQF